MSCELLAGPSLLELRPEQRGCSLSLRLGRRALNRHLERRGAALVHRHVEIGELDEKLLIDGQKKRRRVGERNERVGS